MFSSNQIEEIRKKLQLCGIKDTEFPQADTIGYDDIVSIVHQGQNMKITIGQLLQKFNIKVDSDLSLTSENPVQNKVITNRINNIEDTLFPIKAIFNGGGVFENGTIKSVTVSWLLTRGGRVLIPDHVIINGEEIYPEDTSKTYTGVTDTTNYDISIRYNNNTYNGTVTAKFVNPTYHGVVASNFIDTALNIMSLTKDIKDTKNGSYIYGTINSEKLCYAYPKIFGPLSVIADTNYLNYIHSYKRTELFINNEDYYIYIMDNSVTLNDFKIKYS